MLLYANSDQELTQLLTTHNRALLFFSASWCQPCKQMSPIINKLIEDNQELVVIKIDIEKCLTTTKNLHIMSIPNFCKWADNIMGPLSSGTQTKKALEDILSE
jgi:thioredoxin 1